MNSLFEQELKFVLLFIHRHIGAQQVQNYYVFLKNYGQLQLFGERGLAMDLQLYIAKSIY